MSRRPFYLVEEGVGRDAGELFLGIEGDDPVVAIGLENDLRRSWKSITSADSNFSPRTCAGNPLNRHVPDFGLLPPESRIHRSVS